MKRISGILLALVAAALFVTPAKAQVDKLPPDVQKTLEEIGPNFQKDIRKSIPATTAAFAPLVKAEPKDGVKVTENVSYGSDPKEVLDVFQPTTATNTPIVIFVHGGAYVAGDKGGSSNIGYWFGRQGVLLLNANYPLAPNAKWPSAAKDVGAMVAWAKANGAKYGGDPSRITLMGHSAGATHVSDYLFDKSLQSADGPGVVSAVLISGRYRLEYDPKDPNGKNMQAYFGTDAEQYKNRSAITHISDGVKVPVFLVVTEYDNPGLDVSGAELLAALCKRDSACPRFTRLLIHNHISEMAAFDTPDELLGHQILDFMKRRR